MMDMHEFYTAVMRPNRTYRGRRNSHPASWTTYVYWIGASGIAAPLDPGFEYVKHSQMNFEFEWGYAGSGPAQLAFAILLDYFSGDASRAFIFYQDFRDHVIAKITTDEWELTAEMIEKALEEIREFRSRASKERQCQNFT